MHRTNAPERRQAPAEAPAAGGAHASRRESGGQPPQGPAAGLAERVAARLAEDPSVDPTAVRVIASNDVVRLQGRVPDGAMAERARTIAAAVPGVTGVIDELNVEPTQWSGPAAPVVRGVRAPKPAPPESPEP